MNFKEHRKLNTIRNNMFRDSLSYATIGILANAFDENGKRNTDFDAEFALSYLRKTYIEELNRLEQNS